MAPADLRKEGPAYDLPIALGTLAASEQIRPESLEGALAVHFDQDKQLIPPFTEALEDFREGYMAARNLAPRTRVDYATDGRQFFQLLQSVGMKDLARVGPNHIEAYLA